MLKLKNSRKSLMKIRKSLRLGLLFGVSSFSAIRRTGRNDGPGGGGRTGGTIADRDAYRDTVIKSRDIVSFDYEFSPNSVFYRGYNISHRYCVFSMKLEENQAQVKIYLCEYSNIIRMEFPVPKEKLMHLQELVEQQNLASNHGRYKEVAGIPARVGAKLYIGYASGERISAFNNTGHVIPNYSSSLVFDFFRKIALEAGQEDFATRHDRPPRSDEQYNAITRGTWYTKEDNFTLEFDDDKLKIHEADQLKYEGKFTSKMGIFLNEEKRVRFEPFRDILVKQEHILVKRFREEDLEFSPGEDFYPKMVQGNWQDPDQKYRLEFVGTNLKIFEGEELLLDEEISFRYGSIRLKDSEDKLIGPFQNLYARIGDIQVLPKIDESEDKRIRFYPVTN
ncbi:MAG: hypothetical protein GX138_05115 [Firmicutes bacterium]|nr:hypothetical protein [Bacillota bacterium]